LIDKNGGNNAESTTYRTAEPNGRDQPSLRDTEFVVQRAYQLDAGHIHRAVDHCGFGGGSFGLSYWVQVNTAIAPFLTITGVTHYVFGGNGDFFPLSFIETAGTDPGFLTTRAADGHTGDLGGSGPLVLDGSYHVTDITFALAAGAPAGTYTLRTTTASPRGSIQVTSDFGDAPFPQASFVFTVVPEPSTLALLGLVAVGAGIVAYRRSRG